MHLKTFEEVQFVFTKELSISRFESWGWFQMKGLVISYSIGIFCEMEIKI